jgi:hypothetical protein
MPFNRNFKRVSVGVDPTTGGKALFVEGRSEPPDQATIFVGMPCGPDLQQAPVLNPQDADWEARIPEGWEPFTAGNDVFVFGVAMRPPPHDPFIWSGTFTIEEHTNA